MLTRSNTALTNPRQPAVPLSGTCNPSNNVKRNWKEQIVSIYVPSRAYPSPDGIQLAKVYLGVQVGT